MAVYSCLLMVYRVRQKQVQSRSQIQSSPSRQNEDLRHAKYMVLLKIIPEQFFGRRQKAEGRQKLEMRQQAQDNESWKVGKKCKVFYTVSPMDGGSGGILGGCDSHYLRLQKKAYLSSPAPLEWAELPLLGKSFYKLCAFHHVPICSLWLQKHMLIGSLYHLDKMTWTFCPSPYTLLTTHMGQVEQMRNKLLLIQVPGLFFISTYYSILSDIEPACSNSFP